jgi:putative ABC transport system permease protein
MSKLFGVPLDPLAVVFVAVLVVALGLVGALALRNRVLLKLGIRNATRRRARSALIVLGLMLGTAIIAAALATGDTMSSTIRSGAIKSLGFTDEVIQAKGAKPTLAVTDSGAATGVRYFPATDYQRIVASLSGSRLVDGVAPAIIEAVAALDANSRQNEPQMTLFASDAARMRGFGVIRDHNNHEALSLAQLAAGEVFINAKAAEQLGAHRGDVVRVLAGTSTMTARVRAVVNYDGTGTSKSAVMLPLGAAQRLLGEPGRINKVLVSGRGDEISGADQSNRVVALVRPTLASLGLDVSTVKKDAIKDADTAGAAFMSFFTTFGSFSIAAGVLLIFLIFVMLAGERRGELGIARAVGTRRNHLVQMFVFEGLAYDLVAAAVGALLGLAVAFGMVLLMASAFSSTSDVHVSYAVKPASVAIAYTIGVLLTFAVVTFSAWRVSRMNIVTAIRDLPEPPVRKNRKRRSVAAAAGIVLGVVIAASGASSKAAVPFNLGLSIVVLSLVPLARIFGVPDRLARTVAGLGLVVWFVLPTTRWLLGQTKSDFSIFILSGLMIVIGASWTIMYNADALLGVLSATLGRNRRLAPVLKMSMAYPLRSLFRTGVTFAMFTLVVFTLVVGATTTGAFTGAFNNLKAYGGGFDIRATTAPASPIPDMRRALQHAPGINPADFQVVSSQSFLPVRARQVGPAHAGADYIVRGLDQAFLEHTTYGMASTASGYGSAAAVWNAIRLHPGLAVIDASLAPRRTKFGFAPVPKLKLTGFYLEDKQFAPIQIDTRDPQSGRSVRLKVIGVLSETAPLEMAGISTSQATLTPMFGDRVRPTVQLFALTPGVSAAATAKALESAFLANGMHADALSKLLSDAVGANRTFTLLVEGFMGLGLIVGVAALGVISARAVVERRQQIGVLRAIGFRRRMVQLSFLLESSFIAMSSIVIGTVLGLAVAYNFIHDAQQQPSWSSMTFNPPWLALAIIFTAVYGIALATTYAPSVRASRVYPAEALRYQ